jgi:lipopolysaccharide assembly outer membrane protein LptD (OstA)
MATGAAAQGIDDQEVKISADELSFERERDLYEASGNVRVERPDGRVLTADWLTVNATTQTGVAVGNVVIRDGEDVVRAEFAAVNIRTLEALATQATLDSPMGFAVAGETVQRTGRDTYRIENGSFTTCRCPPGDKRRPWEVEVDEAEIHVGGYATAEDVTFRILDVPVFWTPWIMLPVKTDRQSGFLIPSLANSSRNGTEIEVPFFWAARHDLNVVLRPAYISKRGVKYASDFEYVFGEEAYGVGGGAILPGDDEVEDNPVSDNFSSDRWAFWLRHEQPLLQGLRFGTDVNRISDNNYPLDFEDLGDEARHARYLDTSGWLSFGRAAGYAGVTAEYIDDLQSPNDLDRDSFQLNDLPNVTLAALPMKLGPIPLRASLDSRYTYFYQDEDSQVFEGISALGGQFFDTGIDGRFDADEPDSTGVKTGLDEHEDNFGAFKGGTEGDGIYQEGELLADFGHRTDVTPRLTVEQRLGFLETLGEVGYRGTFYSPRHGSSESRHLVTGRAELRTHLSRELVLGGRALRHIVEPNVSYGYISDDDDQDENPLFIPDGIVKPKRLINEDIRVLLRNPSDRVEEASQIQGGFGNRLYAPPLAAGGGPRLIAEARVGGGYDFEASEATPAFLSASFYPNPNLSLSGVWGYDVEQRHPEEASATVLWRSDPRFTLRSSISERRHEFRLAYRYLNEVPRVFENFKRSDDVFDDFKEELERVNQLDADLNIALFRQLDVFANGFLSLQESSSSSGRVGFAFLSACACWELITSVEQRTRPDETRFTIELRLAGLGFQPLRSGRGLVRDTEKTGSVDEPGGVWESPAP